MVRRTPWPSTKSGGRLGPWSYHAREWRLPVCEASCPGFCATINLKSIAFGASLRALLCSLSMVMARMPSASLMQEPATPRGWTNPRVLQADVVVFATGYAKKYT